MGSSVKQNKHPLLNSWFALFVFLFLINQWLINIKISHWFLFSYFDDLLVLLIILPLALWLMRWLLQKPNFFLEKGMILTAFIMISLVFEVFLPAISEKHTRDFFDILCYGLSGIGFYVYQQNILKK